MLSDASCGLTLHPASSLNAASPTPDMTAGSIFSSSPPLVTRCISDADLSPEALMMAKILGAVTSTQEATVAIQVRDAYAGGLGQFGG